ncbi:MAG TPA: cupin domain-containing protein [Dermatophilaceae bacterium]|nr:cupin domain-containing protein [Dermatophilaceae bacterium]
MTISEAYGILGSSVWLTKGSMMGVIKRPQTPTHDLGGTRFTSLATPSTGTTDTSVWQVEIEAGVPAQPHRLTREEVFIVLGGTARVTLAGQLLQADPGDAIVVPPHADFGIESASDSPLTLLCCLPVGGQAVVEGSAFTPPWAQ